MEKGTLVEFRTHGDRRLAVVDRPEGKKHFLLVDQNGNTHTAHPREIEFVIPETKLANHQIPQFLQRVEDFLDPSSLEVAWEILVEEGNSTNPEMLAKLLFSEVSGVTSYAAYRLLSEDKLYFKQKGIAYEPRSSAQVAELKHQLTINQQRARETELFLDKLRDRLAGNPVEWTASDRARLECVERYALYGEEASDKTAAQELLATFQRPKSEFGAFQLSVDLGIWSIHENIALRRSQIPLGFATEILTKARECLETSIEDAIARRDLTHLHVYTIDDESTTEIDDGLSVEILENGRHRLWIHIADPTRWIQPNDPLDKEARRRGTSVYLPTGSIPMFPRELAEGPMSLIQGKVCHALSFAVDLSDSGAIEDFAIHASLVQPNYRLTYEDVDEMLQMGIERDLDEIARLSKLRNAWRRSQGAIEINLPETIIKVNPDRDYELSLELLDDSFARQLVAEMMILAGEVAARFAQTHAIPIPYRYQGQPEMISEEEIVKLPPGPVREFAICRCMTKGEVGIHPSRHAGLGLDAYAQATSPIRRYSDLLVHFQIKAHLRGDAPPFQAADLTEVLNAIDPAIYEANQIERQTTRYWSLEYLRRHRDTVWRALLLDWLREHERLGLVLLEDLGLKLPMRLQRLAEVGETLHIRVSEVDPRKDVIFFQEAQLVVSA